MKGNIMVGNIKKELKAQTIQKNKINIIILNRTYVKFKNKDFIVI